MNAMSPVGSVDGGIGKSSGAVCVTAGICDEIRIRPVSTLSKRSHHSG
jgi:hypothetical protein